MATLTVIIVAMLSIILWHKKINPETSWIYGGYVLIIVTISLFAVTSL